MRHRADPHDAFAFRRRLKWHCVETAERALPVGPLNRVAEDQEPE
jgi:hypothetical protein